jgi:Domain of unknown function (DUF4105)
MIKKLIFLSLLFSTFNNSFGQFKFVNPIKLSSESNISLLTIDRADEELFQAFGHTAIFVYDPINQIDRVYGFGAFDFRSENYYWKFIKGELPYSISVSDLRYTMLEYSEQYENRSITKQDLNLSQTQKQRVFDILEENYLPENRTYQYKFFQDNCSTRIRDVFQKAIGDSLKLSEKGYEQGHSYRWWMNKYLPHSPWSKFGMNLAIGSPSDKPLTNEEAMYLPDNLMINLDNATNGGKSLVGRKYKLFTSTAETQKAQFHWPTIIFFIIFILNIFYTKYQNRNGNQILLFDRILLFSTGILGVLIVFLWFFTIHGVTMYNWNLLWAWPTNLIVAFILKNKSKYLRIYLALYIFAIIIAVFQGFVLKYFIDSIYPDPVFFILILIAIRLYNFPKRIDPENELNKSPFSFYLNGFK